MCLLTDGPDIDAAIKITALVSSNPPAFKLTCTSSTAPATTVQWSKDGSPVSGGSSSQIVTDTVEATYINELTVSGGHNGTYTCNVATWRAYRDDDPSPDTMVGSSVTASITVEGKVNCITIIGMRCLINLYDHAAYSCGKLHSNMYVIMCMLHCSIYHIR